MDKNVLLKFPEFEQLMGGAFNQDWRDEWSSENEVLSELLDDYPTYRLRLLAELVSIQAKYDSAEIGELIQMCGSGFIPEQDAGVSAGKWIGELIERIEQLQIRASKSR